MSGCLSTINKNLWGTTCGIEDRNKVRSIAISYSVIPADPSIVHFPMISDLSLQGIGKL